MLAAVLTNQTCLENGIRVITEHVPNSNSAAISVLVDAGPQDEKPHQSGLAHLCEHALLLGTPQRNSRELATMIDRAGGCFGAATAPDYTLFYCHVLEDYVSYAIDLVGDILVASKYPEDLLQREKDVISQEILGSLDNPSDLLLGLTKSSMWPSDTLSNSVLGTVENVRSLERTNVVEFVLQQYSPDRITVCAAGSIEHDSVVEQVQDAFWTLRGRSPQRNLGPVVAKGGVKVHTMPTKQCSFSIAVPTPRYDDKRRYALHILNNLICGGMSSRMYQTVRDTHGLVYHIQSQIMSYNRAGLLQVSGGTSVENVIKAVSLILFELTSLAMWERPIDEEELWKSRMQVRSQSQISADMLSNRVSRIATQQFHSGKRINDEDIINAIDAVSIEDIRGVATEILLTGMTNLTISLVGPVPSDGEISEELEHLHQTFSSLTKT